MHSITCQRRSILCWNVVCSFGRKCVVVVYVWMETRRSQQPSRHSRNSTRWMAWTAVWAHLPPPPPSIVMKWHISVRYVALAREFVIIRELERERKSEAVFTSLGRDEDKAVHQDRIISDCFLLCGIRLSSEFRLWGGEINAHAQRTSGWSVSGQSGHPGETFHLDLQYAAIAFTSAPRRGGLWNKWIFVEQYFCVRTLGMAETDSIHCPLFVQRERQIRIVLSYLLCLFFFCRRSHALFLLVICLLFILSRICRVAIGHRNECLRVSTKMIRIEEKINHSDDTTDDTMIFFFFFLFVRRLFCSIAHSSPTHRRFWRMNRYFCRNCEFGPSNAWNDDTYRLSLALLSCCFLPCAIANRHFRHRCRRAIHRDALSPHLHSDSQLLCTKNSDFTSSFFGQQTNEIENKWDKANEPKWG